MYCGHWDQQYKMKRTHTPTLCRHPCVCVCVFEHDSMVVFLVERVVDRKDMCMSTQ